MKKLAGPIGALMAFLFFLFLRKTSRKDLGENGLLLAYVFIGRHGTWVLFLCSVARERNVKGGLGFKAIGGHVCWMRAAEKAADITKYLLCLNHQHRGCPSLILRVAFGERYSLVLLKPNEARY